ncbi:Uncharacterized protein M6B38_238910 [Iris pallida]|uniref:WRC domain-containing protein n=1 Tax=Iris pallida TaxID=29817 RepID=A0AAX6DM80_IRIPA|nr:Uncharacterized protein M6B38_238805 [Iris pallida]KAJ6792922.1 Uncharacterized protein M6B38_238910 [Iris pallida]
MRIRKHAAKILLGSANCIDHSLSPPPPPESPPPVDQCQSAEGGGLFLCQLNCSPWDVNVMDSDALCHFYFQQAEEEDGEEEGRGIMGNVLGFGDEGGVLGISEAVTTTTSSSVVAEPYFDYEDKDETDLKKRRGRYKKQNGDNNDVGGGRATGICKKNDGKGWHCNRPANPHRTLCDHHLTQLKSYSSTRYNNNNSNGGEAVTAADVPRLKNHKKPDVPQVKRRRPKSSVTSHRSGGGGDGGGYYYYYSGFGPSRGKSSRGDKDAKLKEESRSPGGGSDAPIAGEEDDSDDDDDEDDDTNDGNVEIYKGNIRKKRGRKPIKARSLKSLL